jgi:hypothetical protein
MKLNALIAGCLFACASVAAVAPVAAQGVAHRAALFGFNEEEPNNSPGSGLAWVTIDHASATMRVQEAFGGLTTGVTASHIHCCTDTPGSGVAGVATTTPTFTGFPSGVTSGIYDHTFDMNLESSYNASFIAANGGTVEGAFDALVTGLNSGTAYANIHSSMFPPGEIRGFLAPVPEPATYAMFFAGLAMMGALARRRYV